VAGSGAGGANSNGEARVVMGGEVERDSQVNGVWTLTVIDGAEFNLGTLKSWALELTTRMD
jgi:subtilisin-like proprotein convertase family protein